MEEGKTEVFRNNFYQSQDEKQMNNNKRFCAPSSALPELMNNITYQATSAMGPLAMHKHSACSETEMKKALEIAPTLTPAGSHVSLNGSAENQIKPTQAAVPVQMAGVSANCSVSAAMPPGQSFPTGPILMGHQDQPEQQGVSIDFLSSYLQACKLSTNPSTFEAVSTSPFTVSENGDSPATNDLSGGKACPQPAMSANMAQVPQPQERMICYIAMPGSQPVGLPVFLSSSGQSCPPNLIAAPNICPVVTGGTGISPLTANFTSNTAQPVVDPGNHPSNLRGPSFSSDENNSSGTRSYSIVPTGQTQLLRLRKPVLEILRKNLEVPCASNWEALADLHNWNYQEIRSHLTDCRHTRDSPFLKLLETSEFHDYTVQDFMHDMNLIDRRDILKEMQSILQNNKT